MNIFRASTTSKAMTLIALSSRMPLRLHSPPRKRHQFKQTLNMAFIKRRAALCTSTNAKVLAHHMSIFFCKIITLISKEICIKCVYTDM